MGVVDKTGAWYSFNKERIGQGKDNARQFLKDNPDIAAEIEKRIRDKAVIATQSAGAEDETEEATAEEEA